MRIRPGAKISCEINVAGICIRFYDRAIMADLSPYQRKIVDRYYDHRDEIMLTKLQELISELYLAESDKKRDTLWKRVDLAMTNLKVPEAIALHIRTIRKPEVLAQNVEDWLRQARGRR